MPTAGQVTMDVDLTFPVAGVSFTLQVRPGDEPHGATLRLELRAATEGKTARFTRESSYALADFVGGFCRWLGTKGVTAAHTEQEVAGHFRPRYTVLQVLTTTQELCQMLEDKFAAYPHSILAADACEAPA
jgi:hypothetical protein